MEHIVSCHISRHLSADCIISPYQYGLFADDCVLYHPINSMDDCLDLQRDINQLEMWASIWQMKFAPSKCFIMSVTLKRFIPFNSLCNVQLDWARHQKYLLVSVYITCTLNSCDKTTKGLRESLYIMFSVMLKSTQEGMTELHVHILCTVGIMWDINMTSTDSGCRWTVLHFYQLLAYMCRFLFVLSK